MSTAPYTPHHVTHEESDANALRAIVSVLLGGLVAVLGFFALMMWIDANNAKNAANRAADRVAAAPRADASMAGMPGMAATSSTDSSPLTSYAGAAPTNADA